MQNNIQIKLKQHNSTFCKLNESDHIVLFYIYNVSYAYMYYLAHTTY
jgi:hypothetical protein